MNHSATSKHRTRRKYSTEQMVETLRRHVVEEVSVLDLCNEPSLQPSVLYPWQRQAYDNLAAALTTPAALGPSKRKKESAGKFLGRMTLDRLPPEGGGPILRAVAA